MFFHGLCNLWAAFVVAKDVLNNSLVDNVPVKLTQTIENDAKFEAP